MITFEHHLRIQKRGTSTLPLSSLFTENRVCESRLLLARPRRIRICASRESAQLLRRRSYEKSLFRQSVRPCGVFSHRDASRRTQNGAISADGCAGQPTVHATSP